jgi:hypothetical protein
MSKSHSIKILEFSESKITNTITLLVRGSDLVRSDFPDYPNLRKASKNVIVKGILKTLEANQSSFIFPDPIQISAKSYEKFKISGCDNHCVDLEFRCQTNTFIGDGIMNGSHRIEALHQALLAGFNLDNIYLKLEVALGLTDSQIRERCLNLNKSKSPTRLSKNNYAGVFDWMKDILPEDKYSIIYYENQIPKPGIDKNQSYCLANRIAVMPIYINPKAYDFDSLSQNARHPYRLAYPKSNSTDLTQYTSDDYYKLGELLLDLIKLQSFIGKLIEKSHGQPKCDEKGRILAPGKVYPWVTNPSIKDCTHFPDGVILNCKIPSLILTVPIISAFRPWLSEDLEWILPFDSFSEELATKLWKAYQKEIKKHTNAVTLTTHVTAWKIWDELIKISKGFITEKFNELKQTTEEPKTQRVA